MTDYAQGGWAKLDCEASWRLSEVITGFPKSKLEPYTRMLLILYSSMSRDGSVNIGYRTLAERAGTTEKQAYYFIHKLEDDGILINLGKVKTRGGNYTKRQFAWLSSQEKEGATKNCSMGAPKSQGILGEGATKSLGKREHIRYTRSISDSSVGALDAAPPQQIEDSIYTDASMPWGSAATL